MLVNWDTFFVVLVLGMATAPAVMVISKSKITLRLRELIEEKSEFFGDLISCPFCTSVWVSAFWVSALEAPSCLVDRPVMGVIVSWLIIVFVTAPCAWVIFLSYLTAMDAKHDDEEDLGEPDPALDTPSEEQGKTG